MKILHIAAALLLAPATVCHAAEADDARTTAELFGARPDVTSLALSPDGSKIFYATPAHQGQGASLYVRGVADGAKAQYMSAATGNPDRLQDCKWVSNDRLVCTYYGVVMAARGLVPFDRLLAADTDGHNAQMLSAKTNIYTRYVPLGGGWVIDWLPDEDGFVLMNRRYVSDEHLGSRAGSDKEGLGVDRVDTRTLEIKSVERPEVEATDFISDGNGTVRIRGKSLSKGDGMSTGRYAYSYRTQGSRAWLPLSDYNGVTDEGFRPVAIDHDLAYGFRKVDGRIALYSMALDGSMKSDLVYARPDVDIDDVIRIGRHDRVVGLSYVTDIRHDVFFDPEIRKLVASLGRALPQQPIISVVDSSADGSKLLIYAGADNDPGVYYLLDRTAKTMKTLFNVRDGLLNRPMATVKPIGFPAADGTMIPAYLTLPPGKETAKGLPAIVMPHGGPSARDEWGFDWLAQFFAARGYAVIQPNYRGSSGYGDAWFKDQGFKSWQVAIGDVGDAGRWLVAQGIADPSRLAIVGWSYGGYAALQSAVVGNTPFKAVVAIAPVTDLALLRESAHDFTNYQLVRDFVGSGAHVSEGSPAQNAAKIKIPVLMFHGTMDRNVVIAHSQMMASRLKAAGAHYELVTFPGLDHQLDDSKARTDMLVRIDGFLRDTMKF